MPTHGHHKTVRRFHEPGEFHELTFSCFQRLPLLNSQAHCALLSQSLDRAMFSQGFQLAAFVFMPEHVHLLVWPTSKQPRIDHLLKAIKRPFSIRVKQQLLESGSDLLEKLTIRERPGVWRFRFWQEGGGYDRNLSSQASILGAIDYIHLNPVRRSLCDWAVDWKWSSARHYMHANQAVDQELPGISELPSEFYY